MAEAGEVGEVEEESRRPFYTRGEKRFSAPSRNMNPALLAAVVVALLLLALAPWTAAGGPRYRIPELPFRRLGDDDYWVYEVPQFLTDEECDMVLREAEAKGFKESNVYSGPGQETSDLATRRSENTWLPAAESHIDRLISTTVAHVTGLPVDHMEALQVIRYPTGGYFKPHFDPGSDGEIVDRALTVLIYLNDDFEGGGTTFPEIGVTVRPERGKAVLFWSLDDQGRILPKALHGGDPVTCGTKLACNKWVHTGPFRGSLG